MGDALLSLGLGDHLTTVLHAEPPGLFHVGFVVIEVGVIAGGQCACDGMPVNVTLLSHLPESALLRCLTLFHVSFWQIPTPVTSDKKILA